MKTREKGSVTLFVVAVIIPLLFILLSVSLDVNAYFANSQRIQKSVDDAALYGVKFLPYKSAAESAARSYLLNQGREFEAADVIAGADSITVDVTSMTPLTFAHFFGVKTGLITQAYAKARGTPFDSYLMIDRSMYLAPPVFGANGDAWESGRWGTADIFSGMSFQFNGRSVDPLLASQECHNPVFSVLKRAAVHTFDNLSSFGMNRVGVDFYPGGLGSLSVNKELLPGGKSPGIPESNFEDLRRVVDGDGERLIEDTQDDVAVLNAHCAAVSETDGRDWYRVPALNTGFGSTESCSGSMIDTGTWKVREEYLPCLRTRDVIWSRTVHPNEHGSIRSVLDELYWNLTASRTLESRGGLVHRVVRTGIILAGDVPWERGERFERWNDGSTVVREMEEVFSEFREAVQNSLRGPVRIYFVLFSHPGNGLAADPSRIDELEQFFAEQSAVNGASSEDFQVKLLYGSDPEVLTNGIISHLVLEKRTTLLSRGL